MSVFMPTFVNLFSKDIATQKNRDLLMATQCSNWSGILMFRNTKYYIIVLNNRDVIIWFSAFIDSYTILLK